jgi:hypothetical protein
LRLRPKADPVIPGAVPMSSTKRSGRYPGIRTFRACLGVVLVWAVAGCSGGGAAASLSEAQAKAKENFKKRFDKPATKQVRKTSR